MFQLFAGRKTRGIRPWLQSPRRMRAAELARPVPWGNPGDGLAGEEKRLAFEATGVGPRDLGIVRAGALRRRAGQDLAEK